MTLSPVLEDVDYKPGGGGNAFQVYNLYLPTGGVLPLTGAPILVHVTLAAFDSTTDITTNISGFLEEYARAGLAVVNAKVTPGGQGVGGGTFIDDDHANWGVNDTMEYDVAAIVQHIRQEIADSTTEYVGLDPNQVFLYGENAAGTICLWNAFNRDQAGRLTAHPQQAQSSRVQGVIGRRCPTWFPAYADASSSQGHFAGGATYGDATDTDRENASPIQKLYGSALQLNRNLPVYLRSEKETGFEDTSLTEDGFPAADSETSLITNTDSYWVQILMRILRSRVDPVFHTRQSSWITEPPDSGLGNMELGADKDVSITDGVGNYTSDKAEVLRWVMAHAHYHGGDQEVWDVRTSWASQVDVTRTQSATTPEDGALFRRQVQKSASRAERTAHSRTFTVGVENATPAEVTRLNTIWASVGRTQVFSAPSPYSPGHVPARFASPLRVVRRSSVDSSVEVELEEAL